MADLANELKVKVVADVEDLKKGIDNAKDQLDDFGKKADESGKKLDELAKDADKAKKKIQEQEKVTKTAADKLGDMGDATQDLKEGLEELAGGSAGGLQKVTSAFKTFSGTLAGTAIIAGTVAVAYAGMLLALKKYGEYRRDQLDERKQWERLTQAVKDYEASLWGVDRTRLAGEKGAAAALVRLDQLRRSAEDAAASENERTGAIQALKKEYPQYFKDLDDEKIKNGEVAGAYDLATTAIQKSARARAALNTLIENQTQQLVLESSIAAKKAEVDALVTARQKLEANEKYLTQLEGAQNYNTKFNAIQDKINEKVKELAVLGGDVNRTQGRAQELSDIIQQNGGILGGKTSTDDLDKKKERVESIFKTMQAIQGLGAAGLNNPLPGIGGLSGDSEQGPQFGAGAGSTNNTPDYDTLIGNIDRYREKLNKISELAPEMRQSLIDMVPDPASFGGEVEERFNTIFERLQGVKQRMMDFNEDMKSVITGNLSNTLNQLGTVIGQALATGGNVVSAIGQTLIQGLANFLSDMGGLLIEYGTLAVVKGKLDLAIASGGPLAIGAGIAAIAVGIALKAAGAAIAAKASEGFGGGGGNLSGSTAGSGQVNYTSSSYSSQGGYQTSSGRVVFEIAGTKLIGVLSNELARNRSMAGQISLS